MIPTAAFTLLHVFGFASAVAQHSGSSSSARVEPKGVFNIDSSGRSKEVENGEVAQSIVRRRRIDDDSEDKKPDESASTGIRKEIEVASTKNEKEDRKEDTEEDKELFVKHADKSAQWPYPQQVPMVPVMPSQAAPMIPNAVPAYTVPAMPGYAPQGQPVQSQGQMPYSGYAPVQAVQPQGQVPYSGYAPPVQTVQPQGQVPYSGYVPPVQTVQPQGQVPSGYAPQAQTVQPQAQVPDSGVQPDEPRPAAVAPHVRSEGWSTVALFFFYLLVAGVAVFVAIMSGSMIKHCIKNGKNRAAFAIEWRPISSTARSSKG